MVDVSGRSKHLHKKLSKRIRNYAKEAYHLLPFRPAPKQSLLFVVGCQRSGTTLLQHIFEQDWNTKVFPETGSAVTSPDHEYKLRLKPFPLVAKEIDKHKAPLVILKPLVESQNSIELLDYFKGAKAIWLYRHYNDVIASKIKKFGPHSGIGDLRHVANGEEDDWRMEKLPESAQQIVKKYYDQNMNPYDAAALFWYIRNIFVFELDLFNHADVLVWRYEDLVSEPFASMQRMYNFIGCEFPGESILSVVHNTSIGKGHNVNLSPDILELCNDLLNRLNTMYLGQVSSNRQKSTAEAE